jgi:hypothetical protein
MPTGALASRIRKMVQKMEWGNVDVDTTAAAFSLMDDHVMQVPALGQYDFIWVDEISQHSREDFGRVLKLWNLCGRAPALLISGDLDQCPGVDKSRPWESPLWRRRCRIQNLHRAFRCKDRVFWHMLQGIRATKATKEQVRDFCRGRKAWNTHMPTKRDIERLLKKHPSTVMMSCTRKGAAILNELCMQVKYPRRKPIVTLPGDPESNPDNYATGKLAKPEKLKNLEVPIYKGMRLYLTDNVRKQDDYVNGMRVKVEWYCQKSKGLRVRTATGKRLMIFKWNNKHRIGSKAYYPIRPGYASTILKHQGDSLKHATIWLDAPMKGAAYTSLSRVSYRSRYLLGGRLMPMHFRPARGV